MDAKTLLRELSRRGATASLEAGRVWIEPAAALDDELRDRIIELKPELLLLLANGLSTPTPDTAPPADVQRIRELAAQVTPAEFCRARRGITPALRRTCSSSEINELILEVCLLAKGEKTECG